MSLIVKKFGGTSLGTAERLLSVADIIENTAKSDSVITVVSAMSSYQKSEGTTSRLIHAGEAAVEGKDYSKILEMIEKTHTSALETAIKNHEILKKTEADIHNELLRLKSFLEAIHVIHEVSPRSRDLIVGTGERLSAQVLSAILQDRGLKGQYIDLSEIAEDGISSVEPDFNKRLQKLISDVLPKNDRVLPVVTGFFGFVKDGILANVGRGYTDFTAALIAGKLHAKELQIWKEVDGIYTADPRKVPNAVVLDKIFPKEAAELTYFGSEVLHPFTMECAMAGEVPVRIKNTFSPEKPGTVILPQNRFSDDDQTQAKNAVAVTTKGDITGINIYSNRMLHSSGFIAKVFDIFREHKVVIDLISTSEVNISCTVDTLDDLSDMVADLEHLGKVTLIPDRAILSLVGEGMKHVPGVAGRMFTALAENKINIEMIAQGASEINISCVIERSRSAEALQVIHRTFLE